MKTYYFDHAASSWPKPPTVAEAMARCVADYAANPGRGSHSMAVKASRILFETRKNLAKLFGIRNPNDICFALNTTHALNLAIFGYVKPGDHVVSTSLEHNSVRRPLEYLKRTANVEVTYLNSDAKGHIDLQEAKAAMKASTTLIACSHSSNLLGTILPVGELGELARKHGARLLVDAAQTAGIVPMEVGPMGIDMLAFPGHKGLLGPQGTGGLYISPELDLQPYMYGGTGSQSEAVDQPDIRPDRYESGTQNTPGLAGLNEGVKFILNETVEKIHNKEWQLIQRLMEKLSQMDRIEMYGPDLGGDKTGIVAFNRPGIDASELAFILDQHYQIAVRSGFHCTPLAHQSAGTTGGGAVRASIGYFTTEEEIDYFAQSIREIDRHYS